MTETEITPLERYLPYLFRRLSTVINAVLVKELKPYNINVPRWRIIAVLHFTGPSNISALTRLTALTQPGVSQIVEQLTQDGFVKRRLRKDDNRILEISLSKKGEEMFENIIPIILKHQGRLTKGFSEMETEMLIGMCRRMLANMEE